MFSRVLSTVVAIGILSLLGGCIAPPKAPVVTEAERAAASNVRTGPFAWGISTSSYQYEDPDVTPGTASYFVTDWDIMVDQGGAPKKGNALYSWSHFEKDLEALRKIGVTHYRFSIEWARVEPEPGRYNEKAIAGYARMARLLKESGIEPVVCLWHFTFPSWLYDRKNPGRSNWLHPMIDGRWEAYVAKMVRAVGPYTRYYAPQNEPNGQITTAYIAGLWPPRQVAHFASYNRAIARSADLFREAAKVVKSNDREALILSVDALPWWYRSPLDVTGAIYNFMQHNNFDHLDQVYDVCDIIGINYYYSQMAGPYSMLTTGSHHGKNYSMMGWRIDPEALYRQIKTVAARYGRPMMITENGVATLKDSKRVAYIREHVAVIERARKEGYDVRGYFVWSLADNYEWHYGYESKFGLAEMNPKTLTRELKPSAGAYRNMIRTSRWTGRP